MDIIGKTVSKATLIENSLALEFTDGTKANILDGGQSCCEKEVDMWVLIVVSVLSGYARGGVVFQEFTTEANCKAAMNVIDGNAFCVKK